MPAIEQFVAVSHAKTRLPDMLNAIEESDEAIAITKNGVPTAVLLSMARFEGLLETIEILADSDMRRQLGQSAEDIVAGRLLDADEAF
jgi:antitoxin YefM